MPLTNQNLNVTLGGNTDGVLAKISTGTMFLAGGANVTLSQNGNSISIVGGAGAGGFAGAGVSSEGNTSGDTKTVASQVVFAGGNNITLSQGTNGASATVTISALNMFSAGISTGGNSSGDTGVQSGQLVLAGGTNITLSGATGTNGFGTVTISGPNAGAQQMSFWQNIGVNGTNTDAMAQTLVSYNNLSIFQLDIGNNIFAGNMTVKTVLLDVSYDLIGSASTAANSTTAGTIPSYTISAFFGLYTISNTVSLHLLNSGSVSFGTSFTNPASSTGNHVSILQGKRWITMNSSIFSASLTMTQGLYYGAIMFRSSSNSRTLQMYGAMMGESGSRSGTFGLVSTTLNYIGMVPYQGVYSTTTNAFPATILSVDIKKQGISNLFVPHIMFNNIQNIF